MPAIRLGDKPPLRPENWSVTVSVPDGADVADSGLLLAMARDAAPPGYYAVAAVPLSPETIRLHLWPAEWLSVAMTFDPDAGLATGLRPQLLAPIDADDLERYFDDDDYVGQEKLDGRRLLVEVGAAGAGVRGMTRRGRVTPMPVAVADWARRLGQDFQGGLLVDGELVGDTLVAFDMLAFEGVSLRDTGYCSRLVLLETVVGRDAVRPIRLIETAGGTDAKRALVARLRNESKEGVVFKHVSARWRPVRDQADEQDVYVQFSF